MTRLPKAPRPLLPAADEIAAAALAFLAEEPARLVAFLEASGLTPAALRAEIGRPHTMAAVLAHLLADESLLLVFAASKDIRPEWVGPAEAALSERAAREGR
jgi:hypothetical protein